MTKYAFNKRRLIGTTVTVCVIVVGGVLFWWWVESTRIKQRQALIERVTSVGGKVTFSHQYADPHDLARNRFLRPPKPSPVRRLFFGNDIPPQIHGVGFPNGYALDESKLELLQNLNEVRHLDLTATPIDDATVQEIARIKSLWIISLRSTNVTNDGIHFVTDLPELSGSGLLNLPITDESSEDLKRSPRLSWVDLEDTWISEQGSASFAENRPEVEMLWSNPRDEMHREAIVELERVGFWLYRQDADKPVSTYAVFAPHAEQPAPAAFASVWLGTETDTELLLDVPRLTELSLDTDGLPHRFGGDALDTVGQLVSLERLDLKGTEIRDVDLGSVPKLVYSDLR